MLSEISTGVMSVLLSQEFEIIPKNYVQCVFAHIPAGKYVLKISTDTEISTSRIEIRSLYNVTLETVAINETITPDNPYIAIINPAETFHRFRICNTDANATIKLELFDLEQNRDAITNAGNLSEYIADFTENKAENMTWILNYVVRRDDNSRPRAAANYAIGSFKVKKGDIITITYPNGGVIDGGKYTLAEKIVYGTDALSFGFRGLIVGGATYNEYVAEKDMEVTVCAKSAALPTIICYSQQLQKESVELVKERFIRFPYNEMQRKLAITKASRNGEGTPKPLSLLHFSDIHNDFQNVSAIMDFYEQYGDTLHDIILTGDMSSTRFSDYKPIFSLARYNNILLTIGNHDVYDANGNAVGSYDSEEYWATNKQKYDQYFAPSISNWGVVQPNGAEELGLCYYYKDYYSAGYGYRLIVLDGMAFDDEQYYWFVDVLADARRNAMTVVIAEHMPPIDGEDDVVGFDTPFMSFMKGKEGSFATEYLTTNAGSALDAVDDFINGGGEFACWLCGHTHYDVVATLRSHPNQIYISIGSANSGAKSCDMPRENNTESMDLFNIVSIDPYLKLIKISRIGATIDDWGRERDQLTINYLTKQIIK